MLKLFKKLFSKTFVTIAILAFAASLYFCWGWYQEQYNKGLGMYYVYRGDRAYKEANLQKAIDYYNAGLMLYPAHYEAQFNLGNIYVVYEDYYSAAQAYEKAIYYNPKFILARMNLGIVSSEKLGDFDGAIQQYQAVIGTKRHLLSIPFIFNNKKSEKYNKGIAYYNMGVAYREKSLYSNGNEALQQQNLIKAIDAYKKASEILKDHYDTFYNLALANHLAGNFQQAGLNYCKAIELNPMNYEAHYNLAILLRHLKMYREALSELEKATILVSNDSSSNSSSYVFDVLNDVSKTIVDNNQYKYLVEKVDDEQSSTGGITYVHGKIVATEALDRAILKNFKTCETKDFFSKYE